MQAHHEPWLTALFNDYLAGAGNAVLSLAGVHAHDPARPWSVPVTMEIAAAIILMVVAAILRPRLSVDRPGKLQHIFEVIYQFLHKEADEQIGHAGRKHLALFVTIFLFVLFANLLGIIPTLESPTMFTEVPLGIAMVTFGYYNWAGIRENGLGRYLAHFAGPMPLLAPLMVPIELVSHMARPLSLTIRLFANMYAGEQVTLVFLQLTFLIAPAVFMGLHVFVGVLQAYIFTLLTMLYVAGATAHDH
ncbi:MAG: F0F1 ATP synthase subunit A [Bryobacteraceae bacterium]